LAAFAIGCGGAPPAPREVKTSRAPAPTYRLQDGDVEEVIRAVSGARQLAATRPVAIERLARGRFVERLLAGEAEQTTAGLSEEAAFLLAFDLVPRPSKRGAIAPTTDVLTEQVLGFYDVSADKVFVLDAPATSKKALIEQRAVIAHEAQHALQAQHFAKFAAPASADEAMARLALIEGDAQVAMGAYLGAEQGAPVGRSLRRIAEITKQVPLSAVSHGEDNKHLDRALPITRRHLSFPYEEGMLLVSEVYRAGGFPLVDEMYRHPPRSTAEVLHPEKYLAGEVPRRVADPTPPRGYGVATVGTLGELDTEVLLSRCVDRATAARAAAGWAGDRYAVFTGPDKRLGVVWVSAWDTEEDAKELTDALDARPDCFRENGLGSGRGDYAITAEHTVERRGKLVAFVRGLPASAKPAEVRQLFALVGPEPTREPFTTRRPPAQVPLPEPAPGRLSGDVYSNPWLGIVGRVPPGMLAELGDATIDLKVTRPGVLVSGGVAISTRITSPEENARVFAEVQEPFVALAAEHGARVAVIQSGDVSTPLGAAIERTWRVEGTTVEIRMLLVPICAGTGSIVFIQAYADGYARTVLDGWLGSFRWMTNRNVRACDYLDPK
jgi:hypothetical protein